jgi:hypothetical protein
LSSALQQETATQADAGRTYSLRPRTRWKLAMVPTFPQAQNQRKLIGRASRMEASSGSPRLGYYGVTNGDENGPSNSVSGPGIVATWIR